MDKASRNLAHMLAIGALVGSSLHTTQSRQREARTPADIAQRQAKQQAKLARRAARAHGSKA